MDTKQLKNITNTAGYAAKAIGGHNYLIVPAIPVKEQVMNTYLVPAKELEFAQIWNGIPITIRHPVRNNGSANVPEPDVAVIGKFYNGQWDTTGNRVTGEYWIDVDEAMKYVEGQYILNAIYNGSMLETSTGYWADEEQSPGEFNGKKYLTIHRNLKPDHIAILVDAIGACSIADGCGVNRNSLVQKLYMNECAEIFQQGGAGSGDFGHTGRPGQVGGSSPRSKQKPQEKSSKGQKELNRAVKAFYVTPADKASKYRRGYQGRISLMSKAKAAQLYDSLNRGGFDPTLFEVSLDKGTPYSSLTSSSITIQGFPSSAIREISLDALKRKTGESFRNAGCDKCPDLVMQNEEDGESLGEKIDNIRSSFYHTFMQPEETPYIKEVYDDHCLVELGDELYNAYFTTNDQGEIVFDDKDKWKKMELVETQDTPDTEDAAEGEMQDNEALPASSYLVYVDGTGHLPVKDASGKPNHRLMGAAWAALHGGYRGQKYQGPDKAKAIAKLKALYAKEKMPVPSMNSVTTNVVAADAPAELKRIFERVYQDTLKKVKDKARASKIAWGAVKKAGWKQDEKGKWSKEKKGDAVSNISMQSTIPDHKETTMKKFTLNGVLEALRLKGVDVQLNNEEEVDQTMELELEGDEEEGDDKLAPVTNQFTDAEASALKKLAAIDWTKLNQMIEKLPSVMEMAQNAEAEKSTRKAELIGMIINSQGNTFTKEELEGMSLPVLTKMNSQLNANYSGLAGGVVYSNLADDEVVTLPSVIVAKE